MLATLTWNANGREGEKRNALGPFAYHSGCIRQPPHESYGRVSGAMKGPFTARLHIKNILNDAVVDQRGTKPVRKSTDFILMDIWRFHLFSWPLKYLLFHVLFLSQNVLSSDLIIIQGALRKKWS